MLISVGAYSLLWGWRFALGFVILLFIHELGHVIEAKRQGIPISGVVFVPFLGAAMLAKRGSHDAAKGAWLGLAGPILGSLGAAGCWAIGVATGSDLFVALAFIGFLLNLFNLIPVLPLDGGHATAVFHPLFWLFGMAGLIAFAVLLPSPIIILIVLVSGYTTWKQWRNRNDPSLRAYHDGVSDRQRVAIAVVYLGLAGLLAGAMTATHRVRTIESVSVEQRAPTAERLTQAPFVLPD